jgi:hypothetical protein
MALYRLESGVFVFFGYFFLFWDQKLHFWFDPTCKSVIIARGRIRRGEPQRHRGQFFASFPRENYELLLHYLSSPMTTLHKSIMWYGKPTGHGD